jgi:t-SNARE complex subunit (syntaxin)
MYLFGGWYHANSATLSLRYNLKFSMVVYLLQYFVVVIVIVVVVIVVVVVEDYFGYI